MNRFLAHRLSWVKSVGPFCREAAQFNKTMHRMSAPPCQLKACSSFEQMFRIAALLPALIGDLNR